MPLPVELDFYDLVIMHQVLHYLDDPLRAIREAARALRPGGRLLIVDFAPHEEESLRVAHAHRRLGFSTDEVAGYLAAAGLDLIMRRESRPAPASAASSPSPSGSAATAAINSDPFP